MTERPQSLGEEIANSICHGTALLAAIVAIPFLIVAAIPLKAASIVGASIFAATMILLYLTRANGRYRFSFLCGAGVRGLD